ncbi:MAG TPA: hypothetical protein PK544_12560 [Spirochaetota bacterium]|nr:hypothetical protein [Spirochaetota bacterium]HPJ38094.1 hypothetical protein [Spirochaetota bacterium]HPQ54450.1 hypothetical protein [Spirochaetota bacterium]
MIKYFKLFSLFVIFIVSLNCGSSSGSDGDVGYVLQPGGATAYTTGSSYDITFNGSTKNGANKVAIIYNSEVNGTSYVGIGASEDPNNSNSFNMKIYFQSSSIPNSITLDNTNSTIKVTESGSTYTNTSNSITLTFTKIDDNFYQISFSPASIALAPGPVTLQFNTSIKASIIAINE